MTEQGVAPVRILQKLSDVMNKESLLQYEGAQAMNSFSQCFDDLSLDIKTSGRLLISIIDKMTQNTKASIITNSILQAVATVGGLVFMAGGMGGFSAEKAVASTTEESVNSATTTKIAYPTQTKLSKIGKFLKKSFPHAGTTFRDSAFILASLTEGIGFTTDAAISLEKADCSKEKGYLDAHMSINDAKHQLYDSAESSMSKFEGSCSQTSSQAGQTANKVISTDYRSKIARRRV